MTYQLPPREQLVQLLTALQGTIQDYDRANEHIDEPGFEITIGADPDGSWNYQTGSNCYTGNAYGFSFWATNAIYRSDDPDDIDETVAALLAELSDQMEENEQLSLCRGLP